MDLPAIMLCVATILGVPPVSIPEIREQSRTQMWVRYNDDLPAEARARGARINAVYEPPENGRPGVLFIEEIGPEHSEAQFTEALAHEFGHRALEARGRASGKPLAHSLIKSAAGTCRLRFAP